MNSAFSFVASFSKQSFSPRSRSIVAELLARHGFGRIVLIEPDRIEAKNLGRILNSFPADIGELKVDVTARAIRAFNSVPWSKLSQRKSRRRRPCVRRHPVILLLAAWILCLAARRSIVWRHSICSHTLISAFALTPNRRGSSNKYAERCVTCGLMDRASQVVLYSATKKLKPMQCVAMIGSAMSSFARSATFTVLPKPNQQSWRSTCRLRRWA
ncbi:ThiF family adenylyltransferase [Bradyrhizobium sp. CNPSo 4016]|nr:ThiF family adenylyltransferase [Bradyrhizobium glycinis]